VKIAEIFDDDIKTPLEFFRVIVGVGKGIEEGCPAVVGKAFLLSQHAEKGILERRWRFYCGSTNIYIFRVLLTAVLA
jgi:hypothetical protein